MPRAVLNLVDSEDLRQAQAQLRFAPGYVPGQPNEGLVSQLEGSPARLADYDDSGWEVRQDLNKWQGSGFTFAWYRTKVTFPQTNRWQSGSGYQVLIRDVYRRLRGGVDRWGMRPGKGHRARV